MQLFGAMGVGALVKLLGDAGVFSASNTFTLAVGKVKESFVRLGLTKDAPTIAAAGPPTFQAPGVSPAYLGVATSSGRSWAPSTSRAASWPGASSSAPRLLPRPAARPGYTTPPASRAGRDGRPPVALHRRPIAVGGMLVGASFTLFRMRRTWPSASSGVADIKKSAAATRPPPAPSATSLQDRPLRDRGRVRPDDRALLLLHEGCCPAPSSPRS